MTNLHHVSVEMKPKFKSVT